MSATGKRILIVEDQRLIAADIENTLKKLGYQIAGSVASGEEAVPLVLEVRPDLVLMDIQLRGQLDGIEAAAAIRLQLDVPIVYLTANADEETILRAKATGPFGYVVKPFNERELRASIEVALAKGEADQLLAEERERRRAAEEFKLLVQSVPDYAIFLLDAGGRVATWNEGARRIKGYADREILGQHFSVFYPPGESAAKAPGLLLEQALREGRAEAEGWRVRKDGSRFWASVIISPVRDETGKLHGFGKVTRDLTERRRSDQQCEQLIKDLTRAVQVRDDFLSIAAHELRTPLTTLRLQLEGLERVIGEGLVDPERAAKKVQLSLRQGKRLEKLVESLLNATRLSSGPLTLALESFDLRQLVVDSVERLAELAAREGCEVRLQPGVPVIGTWDRSRLDQVLISLLGNAIKYGPGCPVEVGLEASGDEVALEVRDRGIGILEEDHQRIFALYERAVSSRHYGGLGLGLYISRQVIEAHGGTIGVKSAPGEGATFSVRLPRLTRPGPPA